MAEQPRKVGVYDRVRDTATHRRGGVPSWVWILVAVVVLVLLAWWYWASTPSDTATIPPAGPTAGPGTEATPPPTPEQPAR
jgi:hypothetical protein